MSLTSQHILYWENKISTTLSRFNQYKLDTKFRKSYYKHTIACESGVRTERWGKVRIIGRGAFAHVWLVEEERGTLRALKKISKANIRIDHSRELLALVELRAVRPSIFNR